MSLPCCMASTAYICIDQLVLSCMLKRSLWSCLCLFNKRLAQWFFFFDSCSAHLSKGRFCFSSCKSQSVCQKPGESPKHLCFPFLKPGYKPGLLSRSQAGPWHPITTAFSVHASLGSWHCARFMLTLSLDTTPMLCATTQRGQRTITWLSKMNTAMVRAVTLLKAEISGWVQLRSFVLKYGTFWLRTKQTALGLQFHGESSKGS